MRWSFLVAVTVSLVACSVDPSLDSGDAALDTGSESSSPPDATPPPPDATTDATTDAKLDATVDAVADAPNDVTLTTDGPCTTTCPSGSTCNGSFCSVPQGTTCSNAVATAGGSGAFDGTVCGGTGPTITTTCTSPLTASATFLHFTSGGDPWNVTVKAVNGPLQIEVLSACGIGGTACYDLASGASTTIVVNQNSIVAIVNGNGTSCTNWQITYISK